MRSLEGRKCETFPGHSGSRHFMSRTSWAPGLKAEACSNFAQNRILAVGNGLNSTVSLLSDSYRGACGVELSGLCC